jgi:UDP-N-acetyl-D-mannosaminuronic acid transferase (WecB/TagA/CpsF family)
MLPRSKEFGSIDNFKEILQGKSLNIISPNTKLLEEKNLNKLLDSEVTFTYHPNSINLRNRDEFIESFKDIKSDVVLVGCGLQKDYVSYLRYNHNKIAIDVGAMLDAWAGIYSREWFKKGGKQDYLLI